MFLKQIALNNQIIIIKKIIEVCYRNSMLFLFYSYTVHEPWPFSDPFVALEVSQKRRGKDYVPPDVLMFSVIIKQ